MWAVDIVPCNLRALPATVAVDLDNHNPLADLAADAIGARAGAEWVAVAEFVIVAAEEDIDRRSVDSKCDSS